MDVTRNNADNVGGCKHFSMEIHRGGCMPMCWPTLPALNFKIPVVCSIPVGIGLAVAVLGALMVQDFLQRRGPADLKGGFEEIAFARNEQNKGGIMRIYAFSVADTVDADYLGCGELLPYNDYGSMTRVYFFEAGKPAPQSLQLEPPHFDTAQFHPVAVYLKGKDGVGNVSKFASPTEAGG